MSFKLDLGKMKHVKSDDKSTTLRHPLGHTVTLYHNVLSKENQNALKALSKIPKQDETEGQRQENQDKDQYGKVLQKAQGGSIPPSIMPKGGGTTPGQPQMAMMADGGDPNKKVLGIEVQGTGVATPPPPQPSGTAPSPNDEEWPLPSETSVGKDIAAKKDTGMADGGEVKYNNPGVAKKGEDMLKARHAADNTPEQDRKNKTFWNHAEQTLKPLGKRKTFADGGSVPYGMDKSDVPEKSSIDKLIDMKHAESQTPRDEAGTEKELDNFEAQQPPTNLQRTIQDKQSGRANDQVNMDPTLQPGMPGYNEQSQPIGDTEQPPQGAPDMEAPQRGPNQIDQGNDHYGHLDAQGNDADAVPQGDMGQPPQGQPQSQPQPTVQPPTQGVAPQNYQDLHAHLKNQYMQEDQAFAHDLNNGHITPKTYSDLFNYNKDGQERGTLGKIGMIFGMMLGGAGSGLTHQPNVALQMMDKVIANDLDAQKKSKDNAQSFINTNQQRLLQQGQINRMLQEGKLTSAQADTARQDLMIKADAFSRMQMNRVALHEMSQNVQNMPPGSPQRAQAEATLAMMANAVNTENYGLADRASSQTALLGYAGGTQNGQNNPEQAFQSRDRMMRMNGNEKLAEDMEGKHVPGVTGQASITVPPAARDRMSAFNTTLNQLNQAINFKKDNPGASFSLGDRARAQTLMQNLGNQVRVAEDMGVFKKSEAEMMNQMLGKSPADFLSSIRTDPKLREMLKLKLGEQQNLYQQYGLSAPGAQPQGKTTPNQSGPGTEGQMGVSKSGRPMVFKNGAWNYK